MYLIDNILLNSKGNTHMDKSEEMKLTHRSTKDKTQLVTRLKR
jgi:hypothetical protein